MKQVLNDVEAAAFLGLAPQSMRNMRCYKKGPIYHKLGSRIVYRVCDLEAYLARHRINPSTQQETGGHNGDRASQ